MNKSLLPLLSMLLISCQLTGNVPETRDLSAESPERGPQSVTPVLEAERRERGREQSRDIEQLLEGVYVGEEIVEARGPGTGCSHRSVEFQGSLVQLRETDYVETSCEGPRRGEIRISGRMRIGLLSPVDAMKRAMDIDVIRIEAEAHQRSWGLTRKTLNGDPCGLLGLNPGEVKSLAGADCGSFGKFPATGETYYTAISINSSQRIGLPLIPSRWEEPQTPDKRWTTSQEEYSRQDVLSQ